MNRPLSRPVRTPLYRRMLRSWQLYVLLLPALICILLFSYAPMYGVQIAFRDYRAKLGMLGSPWVGMKYMRQFVALSNFGQLIQNTLFISLYSLAFGFWPPIVLALLLNQLRSARFKRLVQTVTYMPHFISVVVLVSMVNIFFSFNNGLVNHFISLLGREPVLFTGRPAWFRTLYVGSGIWQGMGWGAIVYLAALGGVNPELYEAAMVDGATRFQRIRHIDWPALLPTVLTLLILNIGKLMSVGYEKAFLMQNAMNLPVSEIISTYVYKVGLLNAKYSFSAAVGVFNAVINAALVVLANTVSKHLTETSLW